MNFHFGQVDDLVKPARTGVRSLESGELYAWQAMNDSLKRKSCSCTRMDDRRKFSDTKQ